VSASCVEPHPTDYCTFVACASLSLRSGAHVELFASPDIIPLTIAPSQIADPNLWSYSVDIANNPRNAIALKRLLQLPVQSRARSSILLSAGFKTGASDVLNGTLVKVSLSRANLCYYTLKSRFTFSQLSLCRSVHQLNRSRRSARATPTWPCLPGLN